MNKKLFCAYAAFYCVTLPFIGEAIAKFAGLGGLNFVVLGALFVLGVVVAYCDTPEKTGMEKKENEILLIEFMLKMRPLQLRRAANDE